jgi:hypothetical protein
VEDDVMKAPDPERNFDPSNDPSSLRSWIQTMMLLAAMVAFGVTGATCSQTGGGSHAVQP